MGIVYVNRSVRKEFRICWEGLKAIRSGLRSLDEGSIKIDELPEVREFENIKTSRTTIVLPDGSRRDALAYTVDKKKDTSGTTFYAVPFDDGREVGARIYAEKPDVTLTEIGEYTQVKRHKTPTKTGRIK